MASTPRQIKITARLGLIPGLSRRGRSRQRILGLDLPGKRRVKSPEAPAYGSPRLPAPGLRAARLPCFQSLGLGAVNGEPFYKFDCEGTTMPSPSPLGPLLTDSDDDFATMREVIASFDEDAGRNSDCRTGSHFKLARQPSPEPRPHLRGKPLVASSMRNAPVRFAAHGISNTSPSNL